MNLNDWLVWLIIALFYAPLHFLPPVLIVLLGSDSGERRQRLIGTLFDCSASMAFSLATVIWLVARDRLTVAMGILLLSMGLPYIRLLLHRRR